MIFIKKDKLVLSTIFIFLSVIAFCIYEQTNYRSTHQTVTLPVTGKVIVIDAGHGIPDEGAESINGISEAKINLSIALKLQKLLEQSGATVILTRSDDNGIYDIDSKTLKEKKISDLKNRVKIGNESSADMFISIHLNKISDQKYY